MPDLAGREAPLRRALDDRLQPALLAPGAPDARPYALAVAPRLADYAVVEAASLLLQLAGASMDVLQVGQLFRSPYLPASGEAVQRRARLDGELRRMGARLVPGGEIASRIRGARAAEPEFAAAVEAVRGELEGPARRTAARWAEAMQQALRAAGWPKGRVLSTTEYGAARKLHEALATLSGLAGLLPPLTFDDACGELAAILAATPCPPDAGEPQVLVFDRHEDPGIAFEGLWVAGLNADRFPAAAVPNPFLPLALQRAHGLLGATPQGVLEDARHALRAWQGAAPEVIMSWPRQDGDAKLLRSTLVPAAPEFAALTASVARATAVRASARLVPWVDTGLPPLATAAGIVGGVRVLELQSLCPFRAAAEIRLDARALDTPTPGVSPRVRGELMHAALATFWGDIGSHAELLARGVAGRQRAAAAAIEDALRRHRGFLPGPRLVALERAWQERALLALAERELEREPFKVAEREQPHVLEIGRRAQCSSTDSTGSTTAARC